MLSSLEQPKHPAGMLLLGWLSGCFDDLQVDLILLGSVACGDGGWWRTAYLAHQSYGQAGESSSEKHQANGNGQVDP